MNDINFNEDEKLVNPHDKFYKSVFSDIAVVRDFLKNYLPESVLKMVELNDLELQNGSFVDEKLTEVFSDMLFRTTINNRDGYVYFLFEHKSYPDRLVALQLLTYMVRIWNQKVNRENNTHIPVIIPMLIYHGKSKWNIGTLKDLILDYDLLPIEVRKIIPDFHYQVHDLSQFSDEEIKGDAILRITLSVLRDVFQKNGEEFISAIIKASEALNELTERNTGIQYFETYMRYILKSGVGLTNEQLDVVINELSDSFKEGSEVAMTLAESLREEGYEKGIEKGIEKGLEQGEAKAFLKMAVKEISKKFGVLPAEYREKLIQLDAINLETFIDKIDTFTTVEDVRKYLSL
jgi:predicted transposase/invertase (TIGR01784 family)